MSDTNGLSREQVERIGAAYRGPWGPVHKTPDRLLDAVAAMLAEARAEVVRDVDAVLAGEVNSLNQRIPWVHADKINAALARHMPAAVREGGTERSGDVQRPDGRLEPAGPSDGRAWPPAIPSIPGLRTTLCGEALGDMRCQLRRGHDGDHEDYSGVAKERQA